MEILNKLEVKHINKTYDKKQVLKDISFDVKDGEFLSIFIGAIIKKY